MELRDMTTEERLRWQLRYFKYRKSLNIFDALAAYRGCNETQTILTFRQFIQKYYDDYDLEGETIPEFSLIDEPPTCWSWFWHPIRMWRFKKRLKQWKTK